MSEHEDETGGRNAMRACYGVSGPGRVAVGAVIVCLVGGALAGCAAKAPQRGSSNEARSARPRGKARARKGPAVAVPLQRDTLQRVYSQEMLAAMAGQGAEQDLDPTHVEVRGSDGKKYRLVLDLKGVGYELSVPEDKVYGRGGKAPPVELRPSFGALSPTWGSYLPAVALALKAKQFDDGLVAAVDLALEKGIGPLPAKARLLQQMLAAFLKAGALEAAAVVQAALRLRGVSAGKGNKLADRVERLLARRTVVQRTPLGVYTWSEALRRIYLSDKVLQMPLAGMPAAADRAAQALTGRPKVVEAYERYLELAAKLTNGFRIGDLRPGIQAARSGGRVDWPGKVALFPPSRSPETDLVLRLFGARPVPKGFKLADVIVEKIRAGALSLKPRADSGWYARQLYALEALLTVDRLPEGRAVTFDERYRKELEGLFKALYGLTRETHVKQLETPMAGAAPPFPSKTVKLRVSMLLDIEPLVTFYERRAASYAFVRKVLERALGREALSQMRRMTASGPVNVTLDRELAFLEALFRGAARLARRQLGMISGEPTKAERVLSAWRARLAEDPDLGRDIRMMVPVFIDVGTGQVRVWAVLGLASRPVKVTWRTRPKVVSVLDAKGRPLPRERFEVLFENSDEMLPYLVSAEVAVRRLLDRPSFRRLCDRYRTEKAILAHLK